MLIRGKHIITDPSQPDAVLNDGAVCVRGSHIEAVGPYGQLAQQYPHDDVIGSDAFVVLPGLINAHDHGRGVSAFQLGVADDDLELWLMTLLAQRAVDPYLATAYASTQLIESGVTTVLHSYYDGQPASYESTLTATVKAYKQAGLRAVIAMGTLDESPITDLGNTLLPALPPALKTQVQTFLSRRTYLPTEDFLAIFRTWQQEYNHKPSGCIKIMLGPVSVHWCSEALLVCIQKEAEALQTSIQAHVLETVYQRNQALKKHGQTVIAWLENIGLLSPLLSCAHCVWVTEDDIERLAETGTSVVHNPSSNLRLRSGIAPINRMLQMGVNVALGLDSHTLNDDGDMFQELRLAANLHRVPGAGSFYPTAGHIMAMATRSGAQALGLGEEVGLLEAGKKADLILIRLDSVQFPYVDPRQPIVDTLVQRARAADVDTVMINGRLVMQGRKHLTLDKAAIVEQLQSQLAASSTQPDSELDQLINRLKPYAKAHYQACGRSIASPYYAFNGKEV